MFSPKAAPTVCCIWEKKETDHLSFDLFFAERGKDAHNRFIVNMKEAQDSLFIERIDTAYHNGGILAQTTARGQQAGIFI